MCDMRLRCSRPRAISRHLTRCYTRPSTVAPLIVGGTSLHQVRLFIVAPLVGGAIAALAAGTVFDEGGVTDGLRLSAKLTDSQAVRRTSPRLAKWRVDADTPLFHGPHGSLHSVGTVH